MKTKEEAIREAWGSFYEKAKHAIDENGYFNRSKDRDISLLTHFKVDEMHFSGLLIRPKSLQGIETNNSWIRIESIENAPTEQCWIYKDWNNTMFIGYFYNEYGHNAHKDATHYQPIVKPKHPIY